MLFDQNPAPFLMNNVSQNRVFVLAFDLMLFPVIGKFYADARFSFGTDLTPIGSAEKPPCRQNKRRFASKDLTSRHKPAGFVDPQKQPVIFRFSCPLSLLTQIRRPNNRIPAPFPNIGNSTSTFPIIGKLLDYGTDPFRFLCAPAIMLFATSNSFVSAI